MRAHESREVTIRADSVELAGTLTIPSRPRGVAVFAHGSGSGRFSARDRAVASRLNAAGLSTLLFDLPTAEERRDDLDLDLATRRLVDVTRWVTRRSPVAGAPVGLFGAGTGAAAALRAAARLGPLVHAVVSRGGRPDLAAAALSRVQAPTLLIVGGADTEVLARNRDAKDMLPMDTVAAISVVPGASHLFDEPGALERVAELAAAWFRTYVQDYPERTRAAAS